MYILTTTFVVLVTSLVYSLLTYLLNRLVRYSLATFNRLWAPNPVTKLTAILETYLTSLSTIYLTVDDVCLD